MWESGIDARRPFGAAGKLAFSTCALALLVSVAPTETAAAPVCTATGFSRDNINLTAALINPGNVSGDVDATGCNIGIYYGPGAHGRVENANIHGANYFGIVNNSADVDVRNSSISEIGEKPFNGTQHGVAIYWAFGSSSKGDIQGNYIWNYQKGGIVVNGPNATSNITQNTVIGLGPVNFIAQNGIQAGYGADTQIKQNTVAGNAYTGPGQTSSGGVILVGGDCYGGAATINTQVQNNTGLENDVGVWFSNLDASCGPVALSTRNSAKNNALVNNAVTNTTGNGAGPYQAGISDQGSQDVIQDNYICGPGYPGTNSGGLFAIDVTATNDPKVKNNTICSGAPSMAASMALALAPLAAGGSKVTPFK
jgi:hypothetical protein